MNIYYDVEDNHYRTYPDGDKANDNQIEEMVEGKKLSIIKLQQENQQLKERINKALNKIDNMFNKGNDNTIIDDLLELNKILKGSDNDV